MDRPSGPRGGRASGVSAVAIQVLEYLMNHPAAGDTVEGILGCWLTEREHPVERKSVEQALDELERAGLVTVLRAADNRAHYRLEVDRIKDARLLLKHATSG
jgi:DNA-binding transcriptional ArsR family regulator